MDLDIEDRELQEAQAAIDKSWTHASHLITDLQRLDRLAPYRHDLRKLRDEDPATYQALIATHRETKRRLADPQFVAWLVRQGRILDEIA